MVAKSVAAYRWGPVVVKSAWDTSIQTGCVEVAVMASSGVRVPRLRMEKRMGKVVAEANVVCVVVLARLWMGMLEMLWIPSS